jgi:hypothetical protein
MFFFALPIRPCTRCLSENDRIEHFLSRASFLFCLLKIMPALRMSSTGCLAISFHNGSAAVFDANEQLSWQYLQPPSTSDRLTDRNTSCNLVRFSPNGQILVFNGPDQQCNVYMQTDFTTATVRWQLQRILLFENPITALGATDTFLLIAGQIGDVYKVDFARADDESQLQVVSEAYLLTKYSRMLLDLAFIQSEKQASLILIAVQENDIHLKTFSNTSQKDNCCIGHQCSVSYLQLVDNQHLLSASHDGKRSALRSTL